jgi:hypothetical protein
MAMNHALYGRLAQYYDLIYATKDYESETAYQISLIENTKNRRVGIYWKSPAALVDTWSTLKRNSIALDWT